MVARVFSPMYDFETSIDTYPSGTKSCLTRRHMTYICVILNIRIGVLKLCLGFFFLLAVISAGKVYHIISDVILTQEIV